MAQQGDFDPKILGFLCNWCSYAGADLAGASRIQYPTSLRVIRVMCSGRVDPALIVEGFIHGMDGIMVLGCHPGDCHYISGNYYTEKRVKTLQKFLQIIGVKPERLLLEWVSASEGERFANLVKTFTETITNLGPLCNDLPMDELNVRLTAARNVLSQERMRWLINREKELLDGSNTFGEKTKGEEFNRVKLDALVREYEKNRILLSLVDKTLSVREIAKATAMNPRQVLMNLISLEQNGQVTVSEIQQTTPKYRLWR